jgi:hypothetical protein
MKRHQIARLSLVSSLGGILCTAALGLAVFSSAVFSSAVASAAPIVIDDFGQPNPEQFYVIAAINADPLLHKTAHPSILGGERDLLVDVVGSSALTTAAGTVGGGELDFGTSGPVLGMLQYDGVDADQLLPTRALVNAQGLTVDLTGGGTNNALRLDFDSIDGGPPATPLSYTITLTSPLAGVATRTGTLAETASPQSYLIPFASFTPSVNFAFTNVSSITLTLNGGVTQPDSDFKLSLFAAVPEPHSVALLGIGGVALLVAARKRRTH